jgi:hypothetical protein
MRVVDFAELLRESINEKINEKIMNVEATYMNLLTRYIMTVY